MQKSPAKLLTSEVNLENKRLNILAQRINTISENS